MCIQSSPSSPVQSLHFMGYIDNDRTSWLYGTVAGFGAAGWKGGKGILRREGF